ncbi:Protein fmp52, mitochondrial [Mortierella sp. AD094]|nr:Protein fmp52, mitochondrial [Mortierella sp. AD094]
MSIPKSSCLIFGGTGAVGKSLVRDVLGSNSFTRVLTLGRRPVTIDDSFKNTSVLEQQTVNFESVPETFPNSDLPQVVFCTLGTTRSAAKSAEAFKKIDQQYVLESARHIHEKASKDPTTGLSKVHFLYCSASSANANSMLLYSKTKGETEKGLTEIGFEKVSIFRPAFLKVVEPRDSGSSIGEWVVNKALVPLMELVSEKTTTISVASVAESMRLVGTSDKVEVEGVAPKSVEVHPVSKSTVAIYNNTNIHDIVKNHGAVSRS